MWPVDVRVSDMLGSAVTVPSLAGQYYIGGRRDRFLPNSKATTSPIPWPMATRTSPVHRRPRQRCSRNLGRRHRAQARPLTTFFRAARPAQAARRPAPLPSGQKIPSGEARSARGLAPSPCPHNNPPDPLLDLFLAEVGHNSPQSADATRTREGTPNDISSKPPSVPGRASGLGAATARALAAQAAKVAIL